MFDAVPPSACLPQYSEHELSWKTKSSATNVQVCTSQVLTSLLKIICSLDKESQRMFRRDKDCWGTYRGLERGKYEKTGDKETERTRFVNSSVFASLMCLCYSEVACTRFFSVDRFVLSVRQACCRDCHSNQVLFIPTLWTWIWRVTKECQCLPIVAWFGADFLFWSSDCPFSCESFLHTWKSLAVQSDRVCFQPLFLWGCWCAMIFPWSLCLDLLSCLSDNLERIQNWKAHQ